MRCVKKCFEIQHRKELDILLDEANLVGYDLSNYFQINDLFDEIQGILPYMESKKQEFYKLEDLDKAIRSCNSCGLRSCCLGYGPTFPEGKSNVDIMLLGRNPGNQELVNGVPFIGPAGKRVDKFLDEIGISRDQCWVTNVCKCYSENNRPPTYGEIMACSKYLKAEIELIKPKLIIAFGNEAKHMVTPYGSSGVTKYIGDVLNKPNGVLGLIDSFVAIMNHPSSALRSKKGEEDFQKGTLKIKEFLDSKRG